MIWWEETERERERRILYKLVYHHRSCIKRLHSTTKIVYFHNRHRSRTSWANYFHVYKSVSSIMILAEFLKVLVTDSLMIPARIGMITHCIYLHTQRTEIIMAMMIVTGEEQREKNFKKKGETVYVYKGEDEHGEWQRSKLYLNFLLIRWKFEEQQSLSSLTLGSRVRRFEFQLAQVKQQTFTSRGGIHGIALLLHDDPLKRDHIILVYTLVPIIMVFIRHWRFKGTLHPVVSIYLCVYVRLSSSPSSKSQYSYHGLRVCLSYFQGRNSLYWRFIHI